MVPARTSIFSKSAIAIAGFTGAGDIFAQYTYYAYNRFTDMALKPSDFHVLLALHEGPLHGYGIMKHVESESHGTVRLEIGSLYRLLGRLLDEGLIEEGAGDERRRMY